MMNRTLFLLAALLALAFPASARQTHRTTHRATRRHVTHRSAHGAKTVHVRASTRHMKSGKVVHVKGYNRRK